MSRGDDLRRLDILEACAALEEVLLARGSVSDEILIRAAERLLEISVKPRRTVRQNSKLSISQLIGSVLLAFELFSLITTIEHSQN